MAKKRAGKHESSLIVASSSKEGLRLQDLQDTIKEAIRKLGKGWRANSTRIVDLEVLGGRNTREMRIVGFIVVTLQKKK